MRTPCLQMNTLKQLLEERTQDNQLAIAFVQDLENQWDEAEPWGNDVVVIPLRFPFSDQHLAALSRKLDTFERALFHQWCSSAHDLPVLWTIEPPVEKPAPLVENLIQSFLQRIMDTSLSFCPEP